MKNEKVAVYLSFFSTIVFLLSSVFCYIKINKRMNSNKELINTVAIFNFNTTQSGMNVNPFDMISSKNEEIASSVSKLEVIYTHPSNKTFPFAIVMNNYTSYTKTKEVDGVNSFEYTYEILKNNEIVSSEKEIDSYEANSQITLYEENLKSSKDQAVYEIIFRFYSNQYDQSHLLGAALNSNLQIMAK